MIHYNAKVVNGPLASPPPLTDRRRPCDRDGCDSLALAGRLRQLIEAWEAEGMSDRNLRSAWFDIRKLVMEAEK